MEHQLTFADNEFSSKRRQPYPLQTMFRIHCLQHWYNLSDGAMEDALYEIASMRLFAHLSLDGAIPDQTTIMNFRHLLDQHQLARQLFETINQWLTDSGVMMKQRTLVDATIIEAPASARRLNIHSGSSNSNLTL